MTHINLMLVGAIALACFLIGLFFLRSWKQTHDRFFLFFSLSFFLQGASSLIMGVDGRNPAYKDNLWTYLTGLVAFVVILVAIVDKNGRGARR